MNYKFRYAVFAVLTIGVLLTLAFTFTTPLLYALGNDPSGSSRFHENIDALKKLPLNSSTDIDPELQEMIDAAGPISLSIQVHNLEDARRYLDQLGKNQASLKNLVVRLDMQESEIQELEKNTALQKQILETLLNTSVSLDALQSMELQYYSESTQEMRIPFRLRGDELRKRVQGLNLRYRNASEKVETIGKKLGLDVKKNKESVNDVDKIVQKIALPETTKGIPRVTTPGAGETNSETGGNTTKTAGIDSETGGNTTKTGGTNSETGGNTTKTGGTNSETGGNTTKTGGTNSGTFDNRVSLAVKPETGRYQENIEFTGLSLTSSGNTTPRSETNPVKLYIDGQPFSSAITDKFGFYTARVPVEKLQSGNHTIYSQSPSSRSENRTLTVTPIDSATYLMAGKPDPNGNVTIEGYVEANDEPVKSAPVQIGWDQTHVVTTKTDADGSFKQKIQLSPGRHTVVANFSGEGYPINPSESTPVIVDIPFIRGLGTGNGQEWLIISVIGIGILGLGGLIFSLRHRTKGRTPLPTTIENTDIPADKTGNNLPSSDVHDEHWIEDGRDYGNGTLIAWYGRLLKQQGLSAASQFAYKQLAGRIAQDFHIRQYKSLTSRELSRNCRGKPYCGAFSQLAAVYERIRYRGRKSVEEEVAFETALTLTDELMEGEKE